MATDLRPLLEARSVAVIGASADPGKIGGRPIAYMRRLGFTGRIVPVNPGRAEVQGLPCLPNLDDAGQIDLAIIAAPAAAAADAVASALRAGVRGVILFTAGYAEAGEEGRVAQTALADAARAAGSALLGPNCLGAINIHARLPATFATALEQRSPTAGTFSYMGQSGALGAYWLEMADEAGLGVAKWITTGNEAQVTGADALAYLAADAETRVIGAYIEDIKQPEAFAQAAQTARTAGKTLLAIKSGRSAGGRAAAAAHTAAQAGDDGWYDGFLRECGAIRVQSLTEMIDSARLLTAANPPVRGPRIGVVTVSGGAGVLICDAAVEQGLDIAPLSPEQAADYATFLPSYAQPRNPVDVTGAVVGDRALMTKALGGLGASPGHDAILLFLGSMGSIADDLVESVRVTLAFGKPVVVIWMAAPVAARAALEAMGVPVFDDIPPAVAAIAAVSRTR